MTLNERLKEIEERRDKAHREICDLASGKRKWEMCIPPQATDSDMTLQAPLDDLALLLAVVKELRAALEFYADKQHAKFENSMESSVMRTTRVQGLVETGWRARKAQARVAEILRKKGG